VKTVNQIKNAIERLAQEDQRELAEWLGSRGPADAARSSSDCRPTNVNPAATNRKQLPGFAFQRIPMGWKGKFPGGPRLLGKPVLLIAETQDVPDFSKLPPPLTSLQAALVQEIARVLSPILKRARKEVERIGIEPPEGGGKVPLNIYVWLHYANDDGKSWEFVVERADGSNFGYHLAYQRTRFIEVWAGD
jgi:hypothetical protein